MKLFLQENAKILSAWFFAFRSPDNGSWGLRAQTPNSFRRLGAPPPDPQNTSPLRIFGYASVSVRVDTASKLIIIGVARILD